MLWKKYILISKETKVGQLWIMLTYGVGIIIIVSDWEELS